MSRTRIIPVLLLRNGGLYKTVKFKNALYVGDPVNTVKIFNEKETDELVVLDYNASLDERKIDYKKIAEIAGEAFMPMAYGGGIKTLEDAQRVFDAGYEKVVLNSVLFNDISVIGEIGNIYGAQAVVAAIDVKKNILGKYKVYSHSGTKSTGYSPVEWAKKLEQAGAGEVLINAIDQDGTWNGYNLELIELMAHQVNIPLIACGGAGNASDFSKAVIAGASAVAAGSMFVYQRKGMGVLISFPTGLKI
jgi:cyclase